MPPIRIHNFNLKNVESLPSDVKSKVKLDNSASQFSFGFSISPTEVVVVNVIPVKIKKVISYKNLIAKAVLLMILKQRPDYVKGKSTFSESTEEILIHRLKGSIKNKYDRQVKIKDKSLIVTFDKI